MKIIPFETERLLSQWQNRVEYDFTESGVHPIHLNELISREEYDKCHLITKIKKKYYNNKKSS